MTNNKLTDERVSSERIDAIIRSAERYLSRRGERDFSADGVEETIAALRELQEYRKAAEPVAWMYDGDRALPPPFILGPTDPSEYWKVEYQPLYATPQPAPAVEVRPIALFDGDISPADAEKLAAAIRELNNAPSEPAILAAVEAVPVVMKDHQIRELVNELRDIAVDYHGTQQLRERIARTLRAAMQSGVVKDGWVAVPVEPTAEMVAAAMLSDDVLFDQEDDTMFRVQHGAIWRAMLAAAPDFREIGNSSTKHFRENEETSTKCWCQTCCPVTFADNRFVVCPECGNKRCPHANDHRNACTGSNDPGQEGSAYPAAPQQEVKSEAKK